MTDVPLAETMLLGGRKKADKLSDLVSQAYRQWLERLTTAVRLNMPADDPYVAVHTESLVGVRLCFLRSSDHRLMRGPYRRQLFSAVFVKQSERQSMRDVAITTVKTGMRGRYGNKGAIVARLVVDDSSICFINCHLAAGQKHTRQRNANLIDILEEKSAFPEPSHASTSSTSLFAYRGGGNGSSVLDHEVCFVQGDLNYRIDLNREDVIRSVSCGEYLKLLDFDQLNKERNANQAFRLRTFAEAPITFWPTCASRLRTTGGSDADRRSQTNTTEARTCTIRRRRTGYQRGAIASYTEPRRACGAASRR